MIQTKGIEISDVVVSTILGHGGDGMFPLYLFPKYREILNIIRQQGNTVISKSATAGPRIGNYIQHKPWTWGCIRSLGKEGLLNSYGLTNPGIDIVSQKIITAIGKGFNVVPNIFFEFAEKEEEREIISKTGYSFLCITGSPNFLNIGELNISCPNSGEDIKKNTEMSINMVKKIKARHPDSILIVKIAYEHPIDFVKQLEDAGADIIHAINTIPFRIIFRNKTSPLAHLGGGGVSGRPAQAFALKKCEEFRKATSLPMIMGCGITDLVTGQRYFNAGADSISICTVIRRNPQNAKDILTYNGWRK